jgi:catechol 2,3-dioxygenase-like lactoylglutathione lyase family enzyme
VPARGSGIHHLDLAVADPARSISFYLDLLGPVGWAVTDRFPSYRGTEEVVYLGPDGAALGIRQADGEAHRYYHVGVEHIAFEVDRRGEVDAAYAGCLARGVTIHFPPEEDRDVPDYYAFFAFDPDGIRVEVFSWKRPNTLS